MKSEFVPGEKLIFFDDFTVMAGDEPPPHWKVRGGTAELRTAGEVRQLTMSTHGMRVSPNVRKLPTNFTLETDYAFGPHSGNGNGFIWSFRRDPGGSPTMIIDVVVQEGGARLNAQAGPIDDSGVDEGAGGYVGIRRARIAEAAPDVSKVIMSGRYVTHGVLFDTDSDRIKPDSAATIKMIADGLQANPGSKFLIEGHTDSTGDAAHNMDLSKRCAEAVKTVLVAQFGIDASRLTTAGLGSSKPVASNDNPQGRAENRRVEFVRQ